MKVLPSKRESGWKQHGHQEFLQGAYGRVKVFKKSSSQTLYAGKIVNYSDDDFRKEEAKILSEMEPHENVVKFHEAEMWSRENEVLIVMELCHVDLEAVLHRTKKYLQIVPTSRGPSIRFVKCPSLTGEEIKSIMVDMVKGVEHLTKCKVLHRDIKPGNILLHNSGGTERAFKAKICDFGLAKKVQTHDPAKHTTGQGTQWYTAPEVRQRHAVYNYKCDIYSLGATFLDIAILGFPRKEKGVLSKYNKLYDEWNHNIPVSKPNEMRRLRNLVPEGLVPVWDLATTMLNENPANRPSLEECRGKIEKFELGDPNSSLEMNVEMEDNDDMDHQNTKSQAKIVESQIKQLLDTLDDPEEQAQIIANLTISSGKKRERPDDEKSMEFS